MSDYTPLGLEKLARKAAQDLTTLRCPRDSVVMRVLACRAERMTGGDPARREFSRVPRGGDWHVREIDVECPACRRRAMGVKIAEGAELAQAGRPDS
jgi:hypothetical protein